jgi:hypothetical protein
MLKGIIAVTLTIMVTVLATTVHAEEYNVNPGMWETTYKVEVSGVPPEMAAMMQQPPRVERGCLTKDDIEFSPDDMDKECTFKSTRHSASKVTWDIQCKGQNGDSTGHGEANFNGNTASGWFEMNVQGGPTGPMKIRTVFEGKRTGPC